jgi:hypothetical protein
MPLKLISMGVIFYLKITWLCFFLSWIFFSALAKKKSLRIDVYQAAKSPTEYT